MAPFHSDLWEEEEEEAAVDSRRGNAEEQKAITQAGTELGHRR